MFTFSQHEADHVLHIQLTGRLDTLAAPEVEERLRDAVVGHVQRFLVDLSGLEYVSSSGLRVFLAFAKLVKRANGQLAFSGLKNEVQQIFELTGFTDILSIHPNMEEALRALNPESS